MPMNAHYRGPIDLPEMIPVFPLPGALLLPRGQMPLNIFEPRYLAMIDDALRDGHRLIGMIQPDPRMPAGRRQAEALQGRLRRPHHPARRDRRRPLSASSSPASRASASRRSSTSPPPIANAASPTRRSPTTSSRARARTRSTARRCSRRSRDFLKANNLKADWEGIENAPNEALVNALAMMSPYGAAGEAGAAGSARPQDPRGNSGRGHRDRTRQEHDRRRDAAAVGCVMARLTTAGQTCGS